MAEIITVDQVLAEITAERNDKGEIKYNRFNKKAFEKLMKAMLNDPKFTTQVAKIKNKELDTPEEIEVSKGFRKFCKHVVEKMGVDKSESEKILTGDFQFDNVSGLYEFFATAMYLYLEKGNNFDLLAKENFTGRSIRIKEIPKTTKTSKATSPKTKEYLGEYETTKEAHLVLGVKTSCPPYLKKIKKL